MSYIDLARDKNDCSLAFRVFLSLVGVAAVAGSSARLQGADWPQWRGPARDGVVPTSPPLTTDWTDRGPRKLWQSEELPSRSGCGSVIVWEDRAYVYVNWPREEAIRTRCVDRSVLSRLRWFDDTAVPAALLKELEEARVSPERPSQRREREAWIDRWLEDHLSDTDLQKKWRNTFRRRLQDGEGALSLSTIRALNGVRDRVFPDADSFERWMDEARITGEERRSVNDAVPSTRRFARDVIVCVGMKDGKTLWKSEVDGEVSDSNGSSTPSIVEGRLFFQGTNGIHCLDAWKGEVIWSTSTAHPAPSSAIVVDGRVIVLNGQLSAYRVADGTLAWAQPALKGNRSSPVVWRHGGTDYIVCNADARGIALVRARDGRFVWNDLLPGGGLSTPVIHDDILVVHSGDKKLGLIAYRLSPDSPERLWSIPLEGRGASSPCIEGGHVYLTGSNTAFCVELESGRVSWKERINADISSPVLADGKLLAMTGNGRVLSALEASPKAYRELARVRVDAARCPSPALVDGKLVLRLKDGIGCFDLRKR